MIFEQRHITFFIAMMLSTHAFSMSVSTWRQKFLSDNLTFKESLRYSKAHLGVDNTEGYMPLRYVAISGYRPETQVFIDNGSEIDVKSRYGLTVLHRACEEGLLDEVRRLIDQGADVNAQTDNGFTPLHGAVFKRHGEIIKLLLQYNADVNIIGYDYSTPIHCLTERHGIYDQNNLDLVEKLLEKATDINAKDNGWCTYLHYAAKNSSNIFIKFLLDKKAAVNMKNYVGDTPLLCATIQCHSEAIELLASNGAEVNAQNREGRTPFYNVCEHYNKYGYKDLYLSIKMLLKNKADINICDNKKSFPLVLYLIKYFKVESQSNDYLHNKFSTNYDCKKSQYNTIESPLSSLIEEKLIPIKDINSMYKHHLENYDLYSKNCVNCWIMKELIRVGANFFEKNSNGETIFDIFNRREELDNATLLSDYVTSSAYNPDVLCMDISPLINILRCFKVINNQRKNSKLFIIPRNIQLMIVGSLKGPWGLKLPGVFKAKISALL